MKDIDTAEAIAIEPLSRWLEQNIPTSQPPYNFELIPAGQSNLTFFVTDAKTQKWVLRRPPLHQILATAHDMTREHTIISALHPTGFAVPEPVAICTDPEVNTHPFYIMEFIEGYVIGDTETALTTPQKIRAQSGASLAETLAELHSINPDEIGLTELAKKADYIPRQLHRWLKQFKQSKAPQAQEVLDLHEYLSQNIPPQKYTGIVHGDYRLDNCILNTETGKVDAVIDWELCTLGDTLADVGTLVIYWAEPSDQSPTLFDSPTAQTGFCSREELISAYQKASQKDLTNIEFYMAFACWRLVCIMQGVYSRYLDGAMSDKVPPGGVENLKERIEVLLEKTADYANNIKGK